MTENIRRDMPAVADQLGLDYRYTELTPFSSLPQPPWDGPSRGVLYNRMHGTWRGHQVWIFDFEKYDTSERNTTREDIRTAICVASSFIRWPRTKISPYKNVDRIAGWFFPESTTAETFGSPPLHVVEGDVLDWPGLKDGRLKEFLQQHPDIEIRLGFGELSIFRVSRCLEASEVEDYLDTAEQLLLIVSTPPDRLVTGGRETQVGEFLVRSNRSRLAWIAGAMVSFFLLVFCCFHLWQAYRQWTATGFASTQGRVNLAAFDDTDPWIGMPANAMEFEYTVNGEVYRGNANDRRFVWRPLRRGDDAARQLSQSWRPGERPTVFYNLGAPHVAVLDNSFTTGDSGFVKLLLFVSGICLTCLAWPRLKQWWGHLHATLLVRSQPVEDVGRARCRLPLMPWTIDTIAVLVLPLSIYGLYGIASLVVEPVGIFATAGVWLKGAIVVNLCAIPVVYLLEKSSGGPGGRWLVADFATQTMSIPQARGPALEVPFGDIRSVRLRDNLRDFSTISIVCSTDAMLAYVDQRSGRTREIRIARCLTRRLAFQLATWLDSVRESGSQLPPAPDQPQVAEESPEGQPRTRFISDVKVEHLSYACLAFGGLVTLLLVTGFVIPAVVLLTLAAVSVLIVPLLLSRQASQ